VTPVTPDSGEPDSTIVTTMDELIHAIREVDQRHLIFCAGSLQGTAMYGTPVSHGWKNVGYTEHFYPGLFGGVPAVETHARFIGINLRAKMALIQQWKAPYLAGEFNVVFERSLTNQEGLQLAAPTQVAVDLMTGPGRSPSEAEELLDWMRRNEQSWRD